MRHTTATGTATGAQPPPVRRFANNVATPNPLSTRARYANCSEVQGTRPWGRFFDTVIHSVRRLPELTSAAKVSPEPFGDGSRHTVQQQRDVGITQVGDGEFGKAVSNVGSHGLPEPLRWIFL